MKEVIIIEHSWLDCSVSYFISIDGVKQTGEYSSKGDAEIGARLLASTIGGKFVSEMKISNELFAKKHDA